MGFFFFCFLFYFLHHQQWTSSKNATIPMYSVISSYCLLDFHSNALSEHILTLLCSCAIHPTFWLYFKQFCLSSETNFTCFMQKTIILNKKIISRPVWNLWKSTIPSSTESFLYECIYSEQYMNSVEFSIVSSAINFFRSVIYPHRVAWNTN